MINKMFNSDLVGFDKFLETMTIIVTIIFTIFMMVIIDNLWITLRSLILIPIIGLFVIATYQYCIAEYRKSMEQYGKLLEYHREILERARRQKHKTSYYDFKKRVEKIRSKELRKIRTGYISSVLVVIMWNIMAFTIMTLFLMKKFYLL